MSGAQFSSQFIHCLHTRWECVHPIIKGQIRGGVRGGGWGWCCFSPSQFIVNKNNKQVQFISFVHRRFMRTTHNIGLKSPVQRTCKGQLSCTFVIIIISKTQQKLCNNNYCFEKRKERKSQPEVPVAASPGNSHDEQHSQQITTEPAVKLNSSTTNLLLRKQTSP